MQKNTNNLDRSIRLIVALVAAYTGYAQTSGWVSYMLYAIAVIMTAVAVTGFCPIYKLLGISTKK
ncbi:MAG: DUF2892 domain-containing protein [Patescibacteria group bacterium]|jgi:uncharacterized membrane protein YtjA (UPF0391 family)